MSFRFTVGQGVVYLLRAQHDATDFPHATLFQCRFVPALLQSSQLLFDSRNRGVESTDFPVSVCWFACFRCSALFANSPRGDCFLPRISTFAVLAACSFATRRMAAAQRYYSPATIACPAFSAPPTHLFGLALEPYAADMCAAQSAFSRIENQALA